jgi:catechol 2,3-dioxygenase-like lactoylglutathione lyase family enzyme
MFVRNRLFTAALLSAGLAVGISATVFAEPVPENERVPIDVRRTTLVVRDIDKSLPLYRDALGLKVVYDQKIGGSVEKDGTVKPPTVRLVLLRANDTFIGVLGLMQRLNVTTPIAAAENKKPQAGQMIMVINAKDLEERFPKIAKVPGVTVATAPERIDYPAAGGGVIPVLFSAVYDPDGFFIEINKLMGTAAGTEAPKPAASIPVIPPAAPAIANTPPTKAEAAKQ